MIVLLVNFLTLNKSVAQIFLDSNTQQVYMPKTIYKAIRSKLILKDSIISIQKEIIAQKDSIIEIDSLESLSYKTELLQKNFTIDTLATNYNKLQKDYNKEKTSVISNFKLWLGITVGLVFGVLIAN